MEYRSMPVTETFEANHPFLAILKQTPSMDIFLMRLLNPNEESSIQSITKERPNSGPLCEINKCGQSKKY